MTKGFSKSPLVWAWVVSALLVCACSEEKELQAEEIAAIEKQAIDNRFVERLSGLLIDSTTRQPIGLKLGEEGTYAAFADDGEIALAVMKYLMKGDETLVAGDEQSYRYVYAFADGRKVEAAGSLQSSGGVYATLRLDVEDLPDISTLLIKTEAALMEDNGISTVRTLNQFYIIDGVPYYLWK